MNNDARRASSASNGASARGGASGQTPESTERRHLEGEVDERFQLRKEHRTQPTPTSRISSFRDYELSFSSVIGAFVYKQFSNKYLLKRKRKNKEKLETFELVYMLKRHKLGFLSMGSELNHNICHDTN